MQFATIFTLALAAATASAAPTRTADAAAPAVAAAAPSSSAASDIVHPRNWNRPRDVSDNYTPVVSSYPLPSSRLANRGGPPPSWAWLRLCFRFGLLTFLVH